MRAGLLRGLADALAAHKPALVELADAETALGAARLGGEVERTMFQLRGFAAEVESGVPYRSVDDAAVAGAPPAGRPRLTLVQVPVGPVAMFSASNFPFAFSVLGGDTAAALAAGCPVVVKAHPGHPRLSRRMFELATQVLAAQGLPAGVLQMVQGPSIRVGVELVRHPAIAAVAFTGSFKGGAALKAECDARPRPIPFYGELGSTNPVVALPSAVESQGEALAVALAASIAQGSGQFCTSPGVLIVFDGAATDAFVDRLAESLGGLSTHAMLTTGIRRSYEQGVERWGAHPAARPLLGPRAAAPEASPPVPYLVELPLQQFESEHGLREEVFGPACVVVRVRTVDEAVRVLRSIGGSLTVTLWGAERPDDDSRALAHAAMAIAGRVLFAGVPTGVAVTHAQHHGGPWPASTAPQTTSVGYAAMNRFLRPVALQDAPDWMLEAGAPR